MLNKKRAAIKPPKAPACGGGAPCTTLTFCGLAPLRGTNACRRLGHKTAIAQNRKAANKTYKTALRDVGQFLGRCLQMKNSNSNLFAYFLI